MNISEALQQQPQEVRNEIDEITLAAMTNDFGFGQLNLLLEAGKRSARMRHLIKQIYNDLPQSRDWLNPDLEREMKEYI